MGLPPETMTPTPSTPVFRKVSPYRSAGGGFAIVIALSLMAFIFLLLVSLVSFTRVESQSAATNLAIVEARANALLGLQVALGELQKHAGPDQLVTAPATTVFPAKNVRDATGELYDIFRNNASGGPRESFLTENDRMGRSPG